MAGQENSREKTYDRLIALADRRAAAHPPALVVRIAALSPGQAQKDAERESWTLIRNALRHLKNGAPGGAPGQMAEAVARASLRSSPFAATLGIRPPVFAQVVSVAHGASGFEEALFCSRRLIEAAESDFEKSCRIIRGSIMSLQPQAAGLNGGEAETLAFRRQAVMAFNTLSDSYAAACRAFRADLAAFRPAPPGRGGPGV